MNIIRNNPRRFQKVLRRNDLDSSFLIKALNMAALRGFVQIVEMLLADPRVNPAQDDYHNPAIAKAARRGHVQIVQLLLPASLLWQKQAALLQAIGHNYDHVARLLLCDPEVEPMYQDNELLKCAILNNRPSMVKLLLPLVDPTYNNNEAIRWAVEYDRRKIVILLYNDPRVHMGTLTEKVTNSLSAEIDKQLRTFQSVKTYVLAKQDQTLVELNLVSLIVVYTCYAVIKRGGPKSPEITQTS